MILVGIPFHNSSEYAVKAARSALAQTVPVDIVFCDDCSSIAHRLAVEEFCEAYKCRIVSTQDRVRRVNPNLGVGVNYLLDLVGDRHSHYLNLESDVEFYDHNALDALVRCLDETPSACAAHALYINAERTNVFYGGESMDLRHPPLDDIPEDMRRRRFVVWSHLSCLLVRGDVARDKRIRVDQDTFRLWYVDFDYCGSLEYHTGKRVMFEPDAWAVHYAHKSSGHRDWPGIDTFEQARQKVQAKWGKG